MKLEFLVLLLCLVVCHCGVTPLALDIDNDDDEAEVQEVNDDDGDGAEFAENGPQTESTQGDPLTVIAEEATALVVDKIDAFARGELFPGPLPAPVPGKPFDPISPFEDAINAGKGLATAGGKFAQGALHLQSKLVAPLFAIGAKITAPIVKLKAKLVAPLAFAGAALTKPIAKGAIKLAAPAIKVQQLAAQNLAPLTDPFVDGITEALNPIRIATLPLQKAAAPIGLAVGLGLGDFNVDEEIANVAIEGDLQRLVQNAENLAEQAILLKNAGVRAAGQGVQNAVQGVQGAFQGVGEGIKKGRKKRESPTVEHQPSFTPPPNFSNDESGAVPEGNDDILNLFIPVDSPHGPTCEAYRSRLVTSQCHRVEEYRTKTCSNLNCRSLNIDAIHRRCQVSAPGVHCEQNCYNYQDANGDTCFNCWFRFTRAISTTGKCEKLNDCLFGSKICPLNNGQRQVLEDDLTLQFVLNQNQQQQQQD